MTETTIDAPPTEARQQRPTGSPDLLALLNDISSWLSSAEARDVPLAAGGAVRRMASLPVTRFEGHVPYTGWLAPQNWREVTHQYAVSSPFWRIVGEHRSQLAVEAWQREQASRAATEMFRREFVWTAEALLEGLAEHDGPPELIEAVDRFHDWLQTTSWRTLKAWHAALGPQENQ